MSRLQVAVLLGAAPEPPPGVDAEAYRRALAEDVYDTAHGLSALEAVLAAAPQDEALARTLAWPGARVHVLREGAPGTPAALLEALDALAAAGAELGAVVASDAPDLPGMLVGKLFSALEDAPCAVCPSDDGTLVGLACSLPVPPWLRASGVSLDTRGAVELLHAAGPHRGVVLGAGWHRLRVPIDVHRLDPGLEGWPATRRLLGG